MDEEKISFFKKILISIKDFEEYPKLASKKWTVVLAYMLKLLAIFTFIATITFSYVIVSKNGTELLNNPTSGEAASILSEFVEKLTNNNSQISTFGIYACVFVLAYFYMYVINFLTLAINVILLGTFGYFTAIILRIHLRYSAMCKIAAHSLTLPIILNIIYILLKAFTGFEIKYFEAMYIAISYVYIVAAILMVKSDIIKNQKELTKIIEEQERVRQELERQKEKEKEEKKEKEKENKKRKDNKKEGSEEKQEKEEDNLEGENA